MPDGSRQIKRPVKRDECKYFFNERVLIGFLLTIVKNHITYIYIYILLSRFSFYIFGVKQTV